MHHHHQLPNWNWVLAASVFSPFCTMLTACFLLAMGLQQHSLPTPLKSTRTEWSQLPSWVCHENSKLLFSAQNAFKHMNALAVFHPNKLLGTMLGNCSTA